MSETSAYKTFLEDEDSLSEELSSLESEMNSLIRRKFELECELNVPRPRKFKDIYTNMPPPQTLGDIDEWDLSNHKMKMHFYELCGIYVADVENGIKVCFNRAPSSKGYYIHLKKGTDSLKVEKYFLPPIVPAKELSDQLPLGGKELSKFCRKIYHYIDIFEDRLSQISALKDQVDPHKINMFSSHSVEYIKIEAQTISCSGSLLKLCMHLYYQPELAFPQKMNIECLELENEEKTTMMEQCKAFKSMPLLLAFQTAFSQGLQ